MVNQSMWSVKVFYTEACCLALPSGRWKSVGKRCHVFQLELFKVSCFRQRGRHNAAGSVIESISKHFCCVRNLLLLEDVWAKVSHLKYPRYVCRYFQSAQLTAFFFQWSQLEILLKSNKYCTKLVKCLTFSLKQTAKEYLPEFWLASVHRGAVGDAGEQVMSPQVKLHPSASQNHSFLINKLLWIATNNLS